VPLSEKVSHMSGFLNHTRRTMITGLLILVPVVITYLVLRLLFDFLDGVLQPAIRTALGFEIPGLGIISLLFLMYLAGLLAISVIGKQMIRFAQGMILKIPLIGVVYSSSRQLIESFSGTGSTGFKRVVMIEYPRADTWTVGFLTGMTTDEAGHPMGLVYIPTAPTPNSGWVAILPIQDIYDTDLSVSTAIRMVLSGGIVAPPQIRKSALAIERQPGI